MTKTLSQLLFEIDPEKTSCKENDCFDEYDRFEAYYNRQKDNISFEEIYYNFFGEKTPEFFNDLIPKLDDALL